MRPQRLIVALALCALFIPRPSFAQALSVPLEFDLPDAGLTPAVAKVMAYARTVELGTQQTLIGSDPWSRFDDAKRTVLEDHKGTVTRLDVQPAGSGKFHVSSQWVNGGDARRDSRAVRLLLDAMGNPGVMVVMLEANLNREVLRPVSDAKLKSVLLAQGFRVQAAPRVYLDHLEEIKKSVEFRKRASIDVTVAQPFGTTLVNKIDEEYIIAWRDLLQGQGNDKATVEAAKSVGAVYMLVGDCSTQELPLPPAASAYAQQGYKQARATISLQVYSVGQQVVAAAATEMATEMDLSLEAAGNKASVAAADRAAVQLGIQIATNIQSRDLQIR